MLLRFACSNFRSIKEKQEILFTAAKHVKEHDEAARTVNGLSKQRVLPVVALYGANASGKSNMLKALEFLKRAALRSHVDWEKGIDRQPFRLDPAWKDEPSSFEIDFLVDGVRYHYGFVCDDEVVREEWLYAKPPGRVLQTWFNRSIDGQVHYGKHVHEFGKVLRGTFFERNKSLIISLFIQSGLGKSGVIFELFRKIVPDDSHFSERDFVDYFRDEKFWDRVSKILMLADTGIVAATISYDNGKGVDLIDLDTQDFFRDIIPETKAAREIFGKWDPAFQHSTGDHKIFFSPKDESRGTMELFYRAMACFSALEEGKTLCIDELDSSLHTLLSRAIIRLFMDPKTNPKGAQLLFTTHDTNLLSTDVLRRDQVWLTEKDQGGATHSYPLSDFKTKPTDDIEAGYLAGRFGAIPYLPPWRSLIGGEG